MDRRRDKDALAVLVGAAEDDRIDLLALAFIEDVVLTAKVHRRDAVVAHHRGDLRGVAARGVDYVFCREVSARGMDSEDIVGLFDRGDLAGKVDLGSVDNGGLSHGAGVFPRVDYRRMRRVERAEDLRVYRGLDSEDLFA